MERKVPEFDADFKRLTMCYDTIYGYYGYLFNKELRLNIITIF